MLQSLINKGSTAGSQKMLNTFKNNYLLIVAGYKIESITPVLIRELVIDPLIKAKKLNTAKTALLRFKQLATFAYGREYTAENVLARLKNDFYTPRQRDRVFSKKEITQFLTWLSAHDDIPAKYLKLSLMLGNRLEELLQLQWCNADLTESTIKLTDTNNKQDLTIKLPHQALAVINELLQLKHSDYVLANGLKPYSHMTTATRIKNIIADTGMVKFSHHLTENI